MRQENAFKIRLIKLPEILRQHSDEDNYMSTTEIIERLAAIGIICDRRTLYKDVELLNESGYEVLCEKSPGKPNGYCVDDRSFNVSELPHSYGCGSSIEFYYTEKDRRTC